MTPIDMYLLILVSKLPDLGSGILFAGVIGFVIQGTVLLAVSIGSLSYRRETDIAIEKASKKSLKLAVVIMIIGTLLNFFGVNMEQMALIYGVPAVVNNEQVQKLPDNVLNLVNNWLEEQNKSVRK